MAGAVLSLVTACGGGVAGEGGARDAAAPTPTRETNDAATDAPFAAFDAGPSPRSDPPVEPTGICPLSPPAEGAACGSVGMVECKYAALTTRGPIAR